MDEVRLARLEEGHTDHTIKLEGMSKDMHSIAKAVGGIEGSIDKISDVLVNQAVKDEHVQSQITANAKGVERAHNRIDELEGTHKKLAWLVITPVMMALLGLVIHNGIKEPENTPQQMQELTNAIKSLRMDLEPTLK